MYMMKILFVVAVFGATVFSANITAAESRGNHAMKAETLKAVNIKLSGYWARAMLPGQKVGGGFVTITNNGSEDDRLISVTTPVASRAEIHEMTIVNDVMKMRPLADGLVVPAGETVTLKPGSYHLMFMAVDKPFREGGTVSVVLAFERAGPVELKLPVMAAGTKSMNDDKMKHDSKTN